MPALKKIKIIGAAFPYRGGIASYNERLAKEFAKEGYSVSVETFTLQYPSLLFPGKSQFSGEKAPENIQISRTINSVNPFNWIKTGKRIRKEKPDIILIGYWLPFLAPCFGTIARIVRKNRHSKVITIAHNIIPHEKRPGDKMLTRYFLKVTDGIIAQSKKVFNDIFKFTDKLPAELSPHPLFDNFGEPVSRDKALKILNLNSDYRYILFFGFIREYKGLDLLIKAFADERLTKLNLKLLVAGEFYTESKPYLELIKKLNISSKVILHTDFIENSSVNIYFSCADIVAQPYKNATQSGVTQIGYHFNKPMLVTNVGGLPEIIPHNVAGYVTEPDEKSIADALFDFFSHNKKEAFEANIKIEKKKFLWSNMTSAILKVYEQTL
ncbi:MAG: glycosyltransferase [Bacteroidales bacterium]|nr:glycosyltransferase [Bacteroidales bacterium]